MNIGIYSISFLVFSNFDTILKNENIHKIHANIVKNVIELKNNTVAVVETDFMEDLKTCFVPFLKKEYEVIYISKPQYYDYHFSIVWLCVLLSSQLNIL